MVIASITPRIYYSTYLRFRKHFKAKYKETMASYFERLSKWLAELEEECRIKSEQLEK